MQRPGRIWIPEAPMLITRPTIEVRDPVMACLGLEGWIGWELIRNGRVVQSSPLQRNLITDAGLNGIGSGVSIITLTTFMGVGTGTNAPAVGDTALQTPLSPRTASNGGFGDTNGPGPSNSYRYWEINRVLVEGEATGNLNEVGFFSTLTGGTMFNRQRFKDGLGADITITKLAADQLRVIFQWRVYPDQSTRNQTVDVNGVSTSVDNRCIDIDGTWVFVPGNLGNYRVAATAYASQTLPDVLQRQSGTGVSTTTGAVAAYSSGTFYRDVETRWEPAVGNTIGDYGSVEFWSMGFSGVEQVTQIATFNPKLIKDATRRVTVTGRLNFNRRP